jgi:hypothetical protein
MFLLPARESFFDGRIFGVPRVRLASTAAFLAPVCPSFFPRRNPGVFRLRLSSAAAVLEFQALSFFLSDNSGVLSAIPEVAVQLGFFHGRITRIGVFSRG